MYSPLKRWTFSIAVLVALGFALPKEANAQFWIGGGLVYGETIGVQANGHLVVNEDNNLRIGADLSYFVREKSDINLDSFQGEVKANLVALNINAHYMLVNAEKQILYAIGGLSFGFVSSEVSGASPEIERALENVVEASETDIGINIGGGLEIDVPFGRAYGELKYVLGGSNQLVIGAGVRIPILGGNK